MTLPPLADRIVSDLQKLPEIEPANAKPSEAKSPHRNTALHEEWAKQAWLRRVLAWLGVFAVLTWALSSVVWIAYFSANKRSPAAFTGGPTLRDATKAWVAKDIRTDYDTLNLFLHTLLVPLNEVSPEGSPFLPFLKGYVAPNVLAKIGESRVRRSEQINTLGLRQSYRMMRIDPKNIIIDQASGKISVKVSGAIKVEFLADPARPPVEFQTEITCIIAPNTPNGVNVFPFYLEGMTPPRQKSLTNS